MPRKETPGTGKSLEEILEDTKKNNDHFPNYYLTKLLEQQTENTKLKRLRIKEALGILLLSFVISSPYLIYISKTNKNGDRYALAVNNIEYSEDLSDTETPIGNPLGNANIVVTQGYGVGSHAPAEIWGGIDLAVDTDKNGIPEPENTLGSPIYATHSGYVRIVPNSWPAGNYISIQNERYKTAYAHLKSYTEGISNGDYVEKGQIIGYVGSSGYSTGPHLHFEIWVFNNETGKWENTNPLEDKFQIFQNLFPESEIRKNLLIINLDEKLSNYNPETLKNSIYLAYEYMQERFGSNLKDSITINANASQGCYLHGIADTTNRIITIHTCNQISPERAISIIVHEIAHQIAHDKYGDNHLLADQILLEGLATWIAGKYWLSEGEDFRQQVRQQFANGFSFPLETNAYNQEYWVMNALYYQWASFVDFLIQKYGWELFNELYISGKQKPGSANYLAIYGKSLGDLEKDWQQWIFYGN